MTGKALGGVLAAILGMVVLCGLGAAAFGSNGAAGCTVPMAVGAAMDVPESH